MRPARVSVMIAIIIRGIKFIITSSIPIPLRNIPRVNTIKNLTGFSRVKYCRKIGIITLKIACCWVLQIEEIKSPTPTIASKEIKIEIINKINEPANGI